MSHLFNKQILLALEIYSKRDSIALIIRTVCTQMFAASLCKLKSIINLFYKKAEKLLSTIHSILLSIQSIIYFFKIIISLNVVAFNNL